MEKQMPFHKETKTMIPNIIASTILCVPVSGWAYTNQTLHQKETSTYIGTIAKPVETVLQKKLEPIKADASISTKKHTQAIRMANAMDLPLDIVGGLTQEVMSTVNCMALNNFYEAGNQGVSGMQAVSQVVINRTESNMFPKSVCVVVAQKVKSTCQFSWKCQMKLPPLDKEKDVRWKRAVMVAKQFVVDGKRMKSLNNALFYHANYVSPNWKGVKKVAVVGDHVFYAKTKQQSEKS